MKTEEFLKGLEDVMSGCLATAKAKNADYAGDGDPFRNLKSVEAFGICSTETGILVRMCDKMSRISNLTHQDAQVKDESIHDTLRDLANYSLILDQYVISKEQDYGTKDIKINKTEQNEVPVLRKR